MTCTLHTTTALHPWQGMSEAREIPKDVRKVAVGRGFENCMGCENRKECEGK